MFSGENPIEPELIDITSEASEIESDIESHTTFPGRSSQETSEAEDGASPSEEVSDSQTNTQSENRNAGSNEREGNDESGPSTHDAVDVNTIDSSGIQETRLPDSQANEPGTQEDPSHLASSCSSSQQVAENLSTAIPTIEEPKEATDPNDSKIMMSDTRLLPPLYSNFQERSQCHRDSLHAALELGDSIYQEAMEMRNRTWDLLASVDRQTSSDSLSAGNPRSPMTDDLSMIVQVGDDVAEIDEIDDNSSMSAPILTAEEEERQRERFKQAKAYAKERTDRDLEARLATAHAEEDNGIMSQRAQETLPDYEFIGRVEYDDEMRPRPTAFAARRDEALMPSYEDDSNSITTHDNEFVRVENPDKQDTSDGGEVETTTEETPLPPGLDARHDGAIVPSYEDVSSTTIKSQETTIIVDDSVKDMSDEKPVEMTTPEVKVNVSIENGVSEVKEHEEGTSTASDEPSSSIDAGTEIVTVESNISSSMEPATEASMSGLSGSAAQNADVMEKEISLTAGLVPEETAGCSEDREMNLTELSEEAELSSVTTLDSDKPEVTQAPSLTEENVVDNKVETATAVSCPEQGSDAVEPVDSTAEEGITTSVNPLSAFTQELVAEPLDADDTTVPLLEPQAELRSESVQADSVHAASEPLQDEVLTSESVIEPPEQPEEILPKDKEATEVKVSSEDSSSQVAEPRLEMEPSFIQEDVDDDFPQTQNMVLELELDENEENIELSVESTSLLDKDRMEDKDLQFSEEMVKEKSSERQEEIDDNISDTDDKVSVAEPVIEMQLLQHESETAFELLHVPEVVSPKSEEVIEEEMHITSDVAIETELPEREKGASAQTEQQESNATTACVSQDEADSVNQLRNEEKLQIAVQSIEEKDSSGLFQIMFLFPCCLKQNRNS